MRGGDGGAAWGVFSAQGMRGGAMRGDGEVSTVIIILLFSCSTPSSLQHIPDHPMLLFWSPEAAFQVVPGEELLALTTGILQHCCVQLLLL